MIDNRVRDAIVFAIYFLSITIGLGTCAKLSEDTNFRWSCKPPLVEEEVLEKPR